MSITKMTIMKMKCQDGQTLNGEFYESKLWFNKDINEFYNFFTVG